MKGRIVGLVALVAIGALGFLGYRHFTAAPESSPQVVDNGVPVVAAPPGTASASAPPPSSAQPERRARYGDWEYQCASVASRPGEQCVLIQNVQDQSDLSLAVVVLRVEDAEARRRDPSVQPARKPVLRVIAPLGVLLPRGLGLKIDETEIGSTGFVRCIANGCVAEVEMDAGLIEQFSKGRQALFSVFLTPDEGRGLPLNLAGFDRGFAELR